MPFGRPTLPQLIERIDGDLESRLGLGPFPRRSLLGVLGRALAGAAHGLHGHLAYLARQIIPDTAESAELDRWASIWGVFRQQATLAGGSALFTGTGTPTIPSGTLVRSPQGIEYETTSEVAIAAGEASAPVQATQAGAAGNADVGTLLNLVTPIAGVDPTATVEDDGNGGGLTGGTDTETDAELLERLLLRIRQAPQGGGLQDYVQWVLETPGVPATRAYALPNHLGLGTVGVTFAIDGAPGGPLPDASMVADVQAYIDERRPVTAVPTVFIPQGLPYAVTLTSIVPDTSPVQLAIAFNVSEFVRRNGGPGGTLLLTQLQEAIATAPGVEDYAISSPVADVVVGDGQLAQAVVSQA